MGKHKQKGSTKEGGASAEAGVGGGGLSGVKGSILDGLLVSLEFMDKDSMTRMLGRLSAFAEGQGKKGQKMESEAEASRGYFGHNMPMSTFREFIRLHRESLTTAERELLGMMKRQGMLDQGRDYLIAYLKNDYNTKKHEMQHARFNLDSNYRQEVTQVWEALPTKQQTHISDFLTRLGYHTDVHLDEFQAFHTTEKANFWGIKVDWDYHGDAEGGRWAR